MQVALVRGSWLDAGHAAGFGEAVVVNRPSHTAMLLPGAGAVSIPRQAPLASQQRIVLAA